MTLAMLLTQVDSELARAESQFQSGDRRTAEWCLGRAIDLFDRIPMAHRPQHFRDFCRLRSAIAAQLVDDRSEFSGTLTDLRRIFDPYGQIVAQERGVA